MVCVRTVKVQDICVVEDSVSVGSACPLWDTSHVMPLIDLDSHASESDGAQMSRILNIKSLRGTVLRQVPDCQLLVSLSVLSLRRCL